MGGRYNDGRALTLTPHQHPLMCAAATESLETRNSADGATRSLGDDSDCNNLSCSYDNDLCCALGDISFNNFASDDDSVGFWGPLTDDVCSYSSTVL